MLAIPRNTLYKTVRKKRHVSQIKPLILLGWFTSVTPAKYQKYHSFFNSLRPKLANISSVDSNPRHSPIVEIYAFCLLMVLASSAIRGNASLGSFL